MSGQIESVLQEGREFPPSEAFRSQANISGMEQYLAMRAEAVLLLAVLVATGWLSTTAVPHGSETSVDALENGRRMIEYLRR